MREGSGCRANSPAGQPQKSLAHKVREPDGGFPTTLKHLRLNCDVLLDSEGFRSQLDEGGGGTDVPKLGSRPMELLLPWLLTGGLD